MRCHVRVQYRPAMYHQGGEPVAVRRKSRNIGRAFRAYVSDSVESLAAYVKDQMARGVRWERI